MNRAIRSRLLWKEFRQQRGFWIAIFVIGVITQLLLWGFVQDSDRSRLLWTLTMALTAFYSLGCSASIFAWEREEGTFETLRALPVSAGTVFFWKTTYTIISSFLMALVLWIVCGVLTRFDILSYSTSEPVSTISQVFLGILVLGVVVCLVLPWGIFFSLLMKRPLHAAIAAAFVLAAPLFFPLVMIAFEKHLAVSGAFPLMVFCLFLSLLIIPVDCWLGFRWFGSSRAHSPFVLLETDVEILEGAATCQPFSHPQMVLGRLVWQQLRESTVLATLLSAVIFPLLWIGLIADSREATGWLVASLIAIQGSCVFLSDQRNGQYQFLTQQGVSPQLLWLSRHLIWLLPVLACMMIVVPFLSDDGPMSATIFVGMGALAYSAGQVASLFCKRGLTAIFFGLIASLCLFGWAWLMTYLEESWWWSVIPIPLILMGVTYWRTPRWLEERNDWRSRLRTGLTLVVPAAVLMTLFVLVRAYSIPRVEGSMLKHLRRMDFEKRDTVGAYRQAADAYVSGPLAEALVPPDEPLASDEIAWLEANREAIRQVLASSHRESSVFYAPHGSRRLLERIADLGDLLVAKARHLQQQGDRDNALELYLTAMRVSEHLRRRALWPEMADRLESRVYEQIPYWAACENQTPKPILDVLRQIETFQTKLPSGVEPIRCRLMAAREALEGNADVFAFLKENQSFPISYFDYELWPNGFLWERTRAVRALDRNTRIALKRCASIETSAASGRPISMLRASDSVKDFSLQPAPPLVRCCILPGEQFSETDLISMIVRRRAVRIVLAFQAYRAESGELPTHINMLTPKYLKTLPIEPYRCQPFTYHPNGSHTSHTLPGLTLETSWKVPANTPFLSCSYHGKDRGDSRGEWIFPIP